MMLRYQMLTSQLLDSFFANFFFARLSRVIKKEGNKTRFEIIPINKVTETSKPKNTVPLKLEATKIPNPKKRIKAV